ncbi:hypothetical protein F4824DRAFT_229853 [Ustulina deusta]|nr:hypothetical protein F4824DRAFT_229853 [Ustulina deusta]
MPRVLGRIVSTHAACDSRAVANVREEIAALRSLAQHPEVSVVFDGHRWFIYNALKQFTTLDKRGLFIGTVQQVQISESPIFPILHICLTLLLRFFILAVTALPDVIGFTIEKRAFNARTLSAQSPTGVQIPSMISFPQARLGVRKWDFTVNRHTYLHSCSR